MTLKSGVSAKVSDVLGINNNYGITTTAWKYLYDESSTSMQTNIIFDGNNRLYYIEGQNMVYFDMAARAATVKAAASASSTGLICYDHGDIIYTFLGTGTSFEAYSISGDSFSALTATPAAMSSKTQPFYGGGDFIYISIAGAMYRYSISGNSWATMTAPGVTLTSFCGCGYYEDEIYYFYYSGSGSSVYIYSISGNSWRTISLVSIGISTSITPQLLCRNGYLFLVDINISNSYRIALANNTVTQIPDPVEFSAWGVANIRDCIIGVFENSGGPNRYYIRRYYCD